MNEQYAERLAAPTRPAESESQHDLVAAVPVPSAKARTERILFVGTVLVTQVSWLGVLAYVAFHLL